MKKVRSYVVFIAFSRDWEGFKRLQNFTRANSPRGLSGLCSVFMGSGLCCFVFGWVAVGPLLSSKFV